MEDPGSFSSQLWESERPGGLLSPFQTKVAKVLEMAGPEDHSYPKWNVLIVISGNYFWRGVVVLGSNPSKNLGEVWHECSWEPELP